MTQVTVLETIFLDPNHKSILLLNPLPDGTISEYSIVFGLKCHHTSSKSRFDFRLANSAELPSTVLFDLSFGEPAQLKSPPIKV